MKVKNVKKDTGCGSEAHLTMGFVGFSLGLVVMMLIVAYVQGDKVAKRAECDDLDQKSRKYSSLYTHLFYPSQKHTHDELKDALAEILTSKYREIEARREQLNCGYSE